MNFFKSSLVSPTRPLRGTAPRVGHNPVSRQFNALPPNPGQLVLTTTIPITMILKLCLCLRSMVKTSLFYLKQSKNILGSNILLWYLFDKRMLQG